MAAFGFSTEVNDINKQKFLAELGQLLTFMYEEDRQAALAMYGKMFDDARDEQDLIQFLSSPTRQAVVIARAYNARARKLQVESQSRQQEGDDPWSGDAPDFVLAIDKLYQEYFPDLGDSAPVMDDQFSLFENAAYPVEDGMDEVFPALDLGGEDAAPAEPAGPEAAEAGDEVSDFLEEYRFDGDLPEAEDDGGAFPEEDGYEEESLFADEETEPLRKPRVPLLILYILLAVPLTLVGVLVLLVPTLLFLALAASSVSVGATLLLAAFGGFTILADFLLLFGTALVLLALGLLFLWIFIWFIGGAIAGMIAGVIRLGGRWCYKEVAA